MIDPGSAAGLGGLGLLGLMVGLVTGATGAGGGALAVPLLLALAGLPLGEAVPLSLTAVGLSALIGAALALRAGELRWRAAIVIGIAGVLAAPLGVTLAQHLPAQPLLLALAGLLLFTAWRQWHPPAPPTPSTRPPICLRWPGQVRLRWTGPCAVSLTGLGLGAGLASGLFGIGGGFVIVPALQKLSDLDLRHIQATSLAVIAAVAASGIAAAAAHQALPGLAALPFAGGSVLGVLVGRRAARHTPPATLRRGFAAVAVLVALIVLGKLVSGLVR